MRFLLDQCTDRRLLIYLREHGHDAVRIGAEYQPGTSDPDVLSLAHVEHRILITDDRDFGELIFRLGQPHAGVIFFRLDTTKLAVKIDRLHHILTHYADQLSQFLVVSESSVRVRGGAPEE